MIYGILTRKRCPRHYRWGKAQITGGEHISRLVETPTEVVLPVAKPERRRYNKESIGQGVKSIKEETSMKDIHFVAFVYLFIINLSAFVVYGWDKLCAKRGCWRVPEKILLLLALLGGSIGAMAAMALFRHKTRHLKFIYGVPMILVLQIAALAYLHM